MTSILRNLACFLLISGCTSSPHHRMPVHAQPSLDLPATCEEVCELQMAGLMAGSCDLRTYRRLRVRGSRCRVVYLRGGQPATPRPVTQKPDDS